MQVCIQDPLNHATYVMKETDLTPFAVKPGDDAPAADVLFIRPSGTLVHELPPSRLTDSAAPNVQIIDPDHQRSFVVGFSDLQRFRVPAPPRNAEDFVWFAMPTAKAVLAAVPVFRRALVQHSS